MKDIFVPKFDGPLHIRVASNSIFTPFEIMREIHPDIGLNYIDVLEKEYGIRDGDTQCVYVEMFVPDTAVFNLHRDGYRVMDENFRVWNIDFKNNAIGIMPIALFEGKNDEDTIFIKSIMRAICITSDYFDLQEFELEIKPILAQGVSDHLRSLKQIRAIEDVCSRHCCF